MSIFNVGFVYDVEYVGPDGKVAWTEKVHNLIPDQGVDFIAGLINGGAAVVPTWYVGIFENDYTPVAGTTAAALPGVVGESLSYQSSTRVEWEEVYDDVAKRLDNSANRAEFVFTADKRIYGGFLVSDPTKSSGAGTLLSIARFSTPRDVETGGTLRVLAGITLVPSS